MGHKAAVAPQPGEGAFNNPAPPHNLETALLVRALDDLEFDPLRGQIGGELVSLVTAIGKDVFDEGKQAAGLFDKSGRAAAILDAGRDRLDSKQQAYRIDKRVAFDAFDFFARVIANRIPAAPPFSVAFTAWVSMMAAPANRLGAGR